MSGSGRGVVVTICPRVPAEPQAELQHVPGLPGVLPLGEFVAPGEVELRAAQAFRVLRGEDVGDRAVRPDEPAARDLEGRTAAAGDPADAGGAVDHDLAGVSQRLRDQRDAQRRAGPAGIASRRGAPIRRRRASCRSRGRPSAARCASRPQAASARRAPDAPSRRRFPPAGGRRDQPGHAPPRWPPRRRPAAPTRRHAHPVGRGSAAQAAGPARTGVPGRPAWRAGAPPARLASPSRAPCGASHAAGAAPSAGLGRPDRRQPRQGRLRRGDRQRALPQGRLAGVASARPVRGTAPRRAPRSTSPRAHAIERARPRTSAATPDASVSRATTLFISTILWAVRAASETRSASALSPGKPGGP